MIFLSYNSSRKDLKLFLDQMVMYWDGFDLGVGMIIQMHEHSERVEFLEKHAPIKFGSKTWERVIKMNFNNHPCTAELAMSMMESWNNILKK